MRCRERFRNRIKKERRVSVLREICGECKYNKRGFAKPQNSGDAEFGWGNEDSDNDGVPTMYDDSC